MGDLYRFGISLEKKLIDAFDKHIQEQRYRNRSEAIRDLIRESLLRKRWSEGSVVAGALVMTYDHNKRELLNKILDIQHDFPGIIISAQHIHLDHHHCLEIIAIKGQAREIEILAGRLKSLVGVAHLGLSVSPASGHLCQGNKDHDILHGHGQNRE